VPLGILLPVPKSRVQWVLKFCHRSRQKSSDPSAESYTTRGLISHAYKKQYKSFSEELTTLVQSRPPSQLGRGIPRPHSQPHRRLRRLASHRLQPVHLGARAYRQLIFRCAANETDRQTGATERTIPHAGGYTAGMGKYDREEQTLVKS